MPEWNGEWDSNSSRYLAATTIMIVLSTTTFILRLVSRRQSGAHIWWDDCFAGIALVSRLEVRIGKHLESNGSEDLVL